MTPDDQNDPPADGPEHEEPGVVLAPGVFVREADLVFRYTRSRGPGGQSVNKVSSRAELRVAVEAIRGLEFLMQERLRRLAGRRLTRDDVIIIDSDTHRSQRRNRAACMARLADLVGRAVHRRRRRIATRPSRGSIERRLTGKRQASEKKRLRKRPDW